MGLSYENSDQQGHSQNYALRLAEGEQTCSFPLCDSVSAQAPSATAWDYFLPLRVRVRVEPRMGVRGKDLLTAPEGEAKVDNSKALGAARGVSALRSRRHNCTNKSKMHKSEVWNNKPWNTRLWGHQELLNSLSERGKCSKLLSQWLQLVTILLPTASVFSVYEHWEE